MTVSAELGAKQPAGLRTSSTGGAPGHRTDIQALRAIAVLAVVINHLWPHRLTGGYVGVDVFFVISGFLISSHIGREIVGTGRVRLGRFYARRIRRLLPAAFLVLIFSLVAAYCLLPYPRWQLNAQEAVASALYWENWLLAVRSVDYSALTQSASLSQHYWSLSVEEQFYLVWPILLLLLFKIRRTRGQLIGIAIVGLGSLAFSVYFTEVAKSQAYFVTPVRVWEFALGALIGLAGTAVVLPRIAAGVAAAAGLAMIMGSAFLFDHHTQFPGFLAVVPTLGTVLVIIAGTRVDRQWHTPILALPPVQFLGNVSYSLYLWHWPLILLAPFALGGTGTLSFSQRAGVFGVALVLAYLSKVLVEDRARSWGPILRSTKLTLAGMAVGMLAVTLAAYALTWNYGQQVAQAAERRTVPGTACHGAAAMVPDSGCPAPFGPADVVIMGPANAYSGSVTDCPPETDLFMLGSRRTTNVCDFSDGAAAPKVAWLVGDSHAQQWEGPLIDLARAQGWVLKRSYLGGCPFAKIQYRYFLGNLSNGDPKPCMNWTPMVADAIARDRPAYVFTSFYARQETADDGSGRSQTEQYRDGLLPYWNAWTDAGAEVFVLGDPPLNAEVRPGDCVTLNPGNPDRCAVDRATAQPPDPLIEVASTSGNPHVKAIDLTDYFCDKAKCYAVIGNVVVYYDPNHLNLEFSRSLLPMIAEATGLRGS